MSAPIDRESASRIRLVVLDADGVLTDGGIYVADGVDGEPFQLRRFHVRDGVGLHLLRRAGVEPVVVSGRSSPAVRARAAELGIEEVRQVSPWEKVGVVGGMLERRGLAWTEAACLADDLPDLAVLERVGLPAAVADAVPEVRARAAWCGELPGGAGAVREFVEALLRARGAWDGQVEAYVRRARGEGGAGGST
ncbi:MAG TPA: hypothetical protein VKA44_08055 [Gemmatimonadota bacterium]|nr:hypothetical protein [Gemmatimonadota bacterium]